MRVSNTLPEKMSSHYSNINVQMFLIFTGRVVRMSMVLGEDAIVCVSSWNMLTGIDPEGARRSRYHTCAAMQRERHSSTSFSHAGQMIYPRLMI